MIFHGSDQSRLLSFSALTLTLGDKKDIQLKGPEPKAVFLTRWWKKTDEETDPSGKRLLKVEAVVMIQRSSGC